ncbi:MAG: thioredoxin family protein [Chlorobium sp.]|uniref:Redox-active disulfide protein 2 n=1 Tax=Chlorobium phaeobacteroides (strain BS1) TaxID=331678 RepID=B3EM93_CHLPB|nr:TM0996/MTH895 family glutaredoxin-like protein [Chlorobium phaeobacteroides]MCW8796880.1 thioredoxin family protein [Chlorobium sp.]MCW8819159.1 thioredoxin family protein [Ignavibacteriaceae bacterium]NEX14858.1 thioredoxin family protein [Prosthecochloris sp.]MBL6955800.1 TM0996/MTH895 family glutaredoxin-like protein [Chlorobium phaeobacteroides]
MKTIKVLGTGCATCKQLESLVRQVVEETGIEASIEKVEDIQEIISWKVLSTPGLVVDNEVKCSGRIPSRDEIEEMLA